MKRAFLSSISLLLPSGFKLLAKITNITEYFN
jgi:hypothetical protein